MEHFRFFNQYNKEFKDVSAQCSISNQKLEISFTLDPNLDFDGVPNKKGHLNNSTITREIKLWEDTCFELFLKNEVGPDYFEVNFSPIKAKWNAFYFSSYRTELKETEKIKFIQSSYWPGKINLQLEIPEGNFQIHPKIVLFQSLSGEVLYLSDFFHPKEGPDFHLFSIS